MGRARCSANELDSVLKCNLRFLGCAWNICFVVCVFSLEPSCSCAAQNLTPPSSHCAADAHSHWTFIYIWKTLRLEIPAIGRQLFSCANFNNRHLVCFRFTSARHKIKCLPYRRGHSFFFLLLHFHIRWLETDLCAFIFYVLFLLFRSVGLYDGG